uniref:Secreted protein n=1 Tax=Heterorhabditis bacteriophora TaxID=37862 RepID=A0A1I7XNJ6_HETBA
MFRILSLLYTFSVVAAESMVYVHPVNPKLHPADMYPVERSMRGLIKIRDLPQAGIVYLNRIKAIEEEFTTTNVVRDKETIVKETSSVPLKEIITQKNVTEDIDYSVYDDPTQLQNSTTSTSKVLSTDPIHTSTTTLISIEKKETTHKAHVNNMKIAVTKTKKIDGESWDLSTESQKSLDKLLEEVSEIDRGNKINNNAINWNAIDKEAKHEEQNTWRPNGQQGNPKAKLVSLSGTAKLHNGVSKHHKSRKAKLVLVDNKRRSKVQSRTAAVQKGPDFDPWERLGQ